MTEFQKGILPLYQTSCTRMVGKMARQVNSIIMGPVLHFIYWEVRSLMRSSAVWNTITVDKGFYKTVDRVLSEALLAELLIYIPE